MVVNRTPLQKSHVNSVRGPGRQVLHSLPMRVHEVGGTLRRALGNMCQNEENYAPQVPV